MKTKYEVQRTGAMIVESTTIVRQIVSAQEEAEFKIERQTLYVPGMPYVCTGNEKCSMDFHHRNPV
ncbi:MAG: hypothetical protein IPL69_20105 [Saprospiraceae bacterium]|nr:hypothetical protein [Candidatus Brachybacter algidus]